MRAVAVAFLVVCLIPLPTAIAERAEWATNCNTHPQSRNCLRDIEECIRYFIPLMELYDCEEVVGQDLPPF